MNPFKKYIYKTSFLLAIFSSPAISFAQECEPGKLCNPIPKVTSLGGLIHTLIEGILKIGMPIIALAIIYCGFLFVKAQGKPEEISKAKSALLYTLIGAAILLGSWAIAQMIRDTVLELSIINPVRVLLL